VPELQRQLAAGALLAATALDRTRSQVLGQGHFQALDNVVDVQTGTVKAKARFANANGALFPSQFVNLQLQLRTIEGATVVPVTALRHGTDGDFVWRLDPTAHTVSMRKVVRGQQTADRVQIAQGLQPGEPVITEGGDRLKEGARVVLPGEQPASGAGTGRRGARGASAPASGASGAWEAGAPGERASGMHRRRASEAAAE
jgi:multidrug efflux system membrane fusion protein